MSEDERKGKPTGDGTRLLPGRAASLEGSTPSPSADSDSQVVERADTQSSEGCAHGREGSTPSLATDSFRGRLTVGRRALNPSMLVRPQPPDLCALVVKRTSRNSPKVEAQVRLLAGVLILIPGVWRTHAALRRRRFMQVRLLPGILAHCQGRAPG